MTDFDERNRRFIEEMGQNEDLRRTSRDWFLQASAAEYSYHFRWLGLPIIQFPQDIVAMQELIWTTQPDLIIETGIARGGSLVFYASMLELLGGDRSVIGIDIDIRQPNRDAIKNHPMIRRIHLIEGSSIAGEVVEQVHRLASGHSAVMVVLDSNHTHDHVLNELELYSPLVGPGSYVVVFDTVIESMPARSFPDRPWDNGNNPATAVRAFLEQNDRFEVDHSIEDKLLISVAPGGYLKCVKA
jgi:cephalosporin hydroxylase